MRNEMPRLPMIPANGALWLLGKKWEFAYGD